MSRITFSLLAVSVVAFASDPVADRASIKAMSGCHEVTYQFAETYGFDPNYKLADAYLEHGLEWITVDGDSDMHIGLQHVLITPGGAMKHWRQDWESGSTRLFGFQGNATWDARTIADSDGQWIQRVYQVDGSPQYECAAPWVHWQGEGQSHNYWECQTWSPLPRREFSHRSDYNVLVRRNRHMLTPEGWVQEQDNLKLKVDGQTQTKIAIEKGLVTYKRVDDARCSEAQTFWASQRAPWSAIHSVFASLYASSDRLRFAGSINNEPMFMPLFDLADQASTSAMDAATTSLRARDIIRPYVLEGTLP